MSNTIQSTAPTVDKIQSQVAKLINHYGLMMYVDEIDGETNILRDGEVIAYVRIGKEEEDINTVTTVSGDHVFFDLEPVGLVECLEALLRRDAARYEWDAPSVVYPLTRNDIRTQYSMSLMGTGAVIGAGAAMVMHGLIPTTSDIDASVTAEVFNEVWKQSRIDMPIKRVYGVEMFTIANTEIDLHCDLQPDHVIIDGIPVTSREGLLAQYETLNREKDQDKIRILKSAQR